MDNSVFYGSKSNSRELEHTDNAHRASPGERLVAESLEQLPRRESNSSNKSTAALPQVTLLTDSHSANTEKGERNAFVLRGAPQEGRVERKDENFGKHLASAQAALIELGKLKEHRPDDKVCITTGDGRKIQITVERACQIIRAELDSAVASAARVDLSLVKNAIAETDKKARAASNEEEYKNLRKEQASLEKVIDLVNMSKLAKSTFEREYHEFKLSNLQKDLEKLSARKEETMDNSGVRQKEKLVSQIEDEKAKIKEIKKEILANELIAKREETANEKNRPSKPGDSLRNDLAVVQELAGHGKYGEARTYLDEIKKIAPGLTFEQPYKHLSAAVDYLSKHKDEHKLPPGCPIELTQRAVEEAGRNNFKSATELFKQATEKADTQDLKPVHAKLMELAEEKKLHKDNPYILRFLESRENDWSSLGLASELTRMEHTNVLLKAKDYKGACEQLLELHKMNPQFARTNPEFENLFQKAMNKGSSRFDNPADYMDSIKILIENYKEHGGARNREAILTEIKKAVAAAEKIDKEIMRDNQKFIKEQIYKLDPVKDKDKIAQLQNLHQVMWFMEHCSSTYKVLQARFEADSGNYDKAKNLLIDVRDNDEIVSKNLNMKELLKNCEEPSFWEKIRNIAFDVVAIGCGIVGGVLASLAGTPAAGVPAGAVIAGIVKGALRACWGDEGGFWGGFVDGAIDGATGAIGGIANIGLRSMEKRAAMEAVGAWAAQGTIRSALWSGLKGFAANYPMYYFSNKAKDALSEWNGNGANKNFFGQVSYEAGSSVLYSETISGNGRALVSKLGVQWLSRLANELAAVNSPTQALLEGMKQHFLDYPQADAEKRQEAFDNVLKAGIFKARKWK